MIGKGKLLKMFDKKYVFLNISVLGYSLIVFSFNYLTQAMGGIPFSISDVILYLGMFLFSYIFGFVLLKYICKLGLIKKWLALSLRIFAILLIGFTIIAIAIPRSSINIFIFNYYLLFLLSPILLIKKGS